MAVYQVGSETSGPSRYRFWTQRRVRASLYQALTLIAIGIILFFFARNATLNLASRGLTAGFGFLGKEAGFGIGFSIIPYSETSSYGRAFLVGLTNTILVAATAIVCSTILGFILGVARLSPNWPAAAFAGAFVEIVRNIPLLLQLLFWYNVALRSLPPVRQSLSIANFVFLSNRGIFVPGPDFGPGSGIVTMVAAVAIAVTVLLWRWAMRRREATGRSFPVLPIGSLLLFGVPTAAAAVLGWPFEWHAPVLRGFSFTGGMALPPEFAALLFALSIYNAAFIAEIVRCSIVAIPSGQSEAAAAMGLRRPQILKLVIIPQALRIIVPPLSNQYLHLLKASSLATAISYPDLVNVFTGTVLNQTGRAIEIVFMTMATYLVLSLFVSALANLYNQRNIIVER